MEYCVRNLFISSIYPSHTSTLIPVSTPVGPRDNISCWVTLSGSEYKITHELCSSCNVTGIKNKVVITSLKRTIRTIKEIIHTAKHSLATRRKLLHKAWLTSHWWSEEVYKSAPNASVSSTTALHLHFYRPGELDPLHSLYEPLGKYFQYLTEDLVFCRKCDAKQCRLPFLIH